MDLGRDENPAETMDPSSSADADEGTDSAEPPACSGAPLTSCSWLGEDWKTCQRRHEEQSTQPGRVWAPAHAGWVRMSGCMSGCSVWVGGSQVGHTRGLGG